MGEAINIIGLGVTDPHIRIHEDRAFLYASRDSSIHNSGFVMNEWQVWSSDDLLNWTLESTLRPEDTYIRKPLDGCWATDAIEKDGRYYWVFSQVDKDENSHQIGMMVGDSPGGPWTDLLGKPLLPNKIVNTEVYDPCLFKDDDGTVYIFFGAWDYYFAPLSDDMRSIKGEPRRITIQNPAGPYGEGRTDDKVFLHKRDGIYYLSWGSYYATSSNIEGPYTYKGCIIDPSLMEARFRTSTWPNGPTQGRHGSFFEWNNQWYFAYCEMCFSGNRYFRDFWISYVRYDEDGAIEPITVDSQCVGNYDSQRGPIEAANYFKGTGTTIRKTTPGGYGIVLQGDGSHAFYPNLHNASGFQMLTLSVSTTCRGAHLVVENKRIAAGPLVRVNLDFIRDKGTQVLTFNFSHQIDGSADIDIRLEGPEGVSATINWFQFSE
jgi:hypothetical protein